MHIKQRAPGRGKLSLLCGHNSLDSKRMWYGFSIYYPVSFHKFRRKHRIWWIRNRQVAAYNQYVVFIAIGCSTPQIALLSFQRYKLAITLGN